MFILFIEILLGVRNYPFFSRFFKRHYLRNLRYAMQGYRSLRTNNNLDFISKLKIQIAQKDFLRISGKENRWLFSDIIKLDLSLKQFLLHKIFLGLQIHQALLISLSPRKNLVSLPLPIEWRDVFRKNNVKLDEFKVKIYWIIFIFFNYALSVYQIIKLNCLCALNIRSFCGKQLSQNYAYFEGLNKTSLPDFGDDSKSYDILSWYLKWNGRFPGIEKIYHNVPLGNLEVGLVGIEYKKNFLIVNQSVCKFFFFLYWSIIAIFSSFFDVLRGRWWNAILLGEAAKIKLTSLTNPNDLAKDYMFQSDWIYKPLWTYEAEKKGSNVYFYFYSTNSEGIKTKSGYKPHDYDWHNLSWKQYLVWDNYQANFIKAISANNPKLITVGPIWFQNSSLSLPPIPKNSIAVFDVQPFRKSRYELYGIPTEFYIPEYCILFIKDIIEVAKFLGYSVVWKRKRQIGKFLHPKFRQFIDQLKFESNLVQVDEGVAAIRLIQDTDVCISMPFTSTALIGKHLKKPNCYYDASGLVTQGDKGAHEVEIVSGREELKRWLLSQKIS